MDILGNIMDRYKFRNFFLEGNNFRVSSVGVVKYLCNKDTNTATL